MRLFWKEHIPLIIIFGIQIILVGSLIWLALDMHSLEVPLYSAVLIVSMLAIYLVYRYVSHMKLYQRLNEPMANMDQSLLELGEAPLAEATTLLLRSQFQLYNNKMYETQQKLEYHTAFINRWVHQMKTPISVIQLTLQDLDLEDEVQDHIQEEMDRLKKGLEMALYTSRLDQFQHDFRVDQLSLRKVVEAAVADHRMWFIRKHVYPELRVQADLTVYSDTKWLQFMIGQVITNAVNYSAGKGKRVIFTSYLQGPHIVLDITDQGIGIVPEDLGRVFEPYFTGNQGRQYHESTGMGLYLVREVCRKLGHNVEINSVHGEGTSVRFTFYK
ncbi:sensor histidine kinase [Paenibacillus pini]|uniref:histidine kinase n=1 Tax=Paenibacillus pini JCM 16418 TaxID=1236976 RepID=W7YZD8_9BACL|nr:sensor histidine kinase [Paenibacillus pini]GAF07729.1 two-component sensor kinase YvcQ [Paenibacillus pini JCM 16418]